MNYNSRRSYAYNEPKSFFSGALNWLILLVVVALIGLAGYALLSGRGKSPVIWDGSGIGSVINAQVVGSNNAAIGQSLSFPAISQRDKGQYLSETEWREWSPSACSAAALTAVLNGYGKGVKISDVLNFMRDQNAISSSRGLYSYGVFSSIATKYGLRAEYSESKDLETHYSKIITALNQGYPVVVNIQDSNYFPNGHFIVAVKNNPDTDTISIINPDPEKGKSVAQEWSRATFKTYFSRALRSAIYRQL